MNDPQESFFSVFHSRNEDKGFFTAFDRLQKLFFDYVQDSLPICNHFFGIKTKKYLHYLTILIKIISENKDKNNF